MKGKKIITAVFRSLLICLLIFFAIALGLVGSDWAKGPLSGEDGLDFGEQISQDTSRTIEPQTIAASSGGSLVAYHYPNRSKVGPLIVLVHGSGWHGLQFDALATSLGDRADVVVPDLRGHGFSPERRGDVDYIGQLEDDLADVISHFKTDGQKVVLLGHSSGGGLVVRMAGGPQRMLFDAAVLLAPFLKYNAPTTRDNSGGWARPFTRRIVGLTMLNAVGITALNHLDVIEFRFPETVRNGRHGESATDTYSYRMNTSFAPRSDYLKDISSLPPFLLVVGAEDEAFVADRFEPLMSDVTDQGTYIVVQDANHLEIVNHPQAESAIHAFLADLAN